MSRRKRWIERAKSLLILLLAAGAVYQAWMTGLFQRMLPAGASIVPAEPTAAVNSYPMAAMPFSAATTGTSGLVYGVCYDDKAMEELLEEFRGVLGETLGSASTPEPVDEAAWQEALLGPGLFLEYREPVALNALARWMGTVGSFDPEQRAQRLILSLGPEERVQLYYLDAQGAACRCDTLALGSTLNALLNAFLPNGAEFALLVQSLRDCDPYSLILQDLPALKVISADDSGRESALQKAAELCQVKLNAGSSFQEQDGIVYLGENGRLRLEADGSFRYTAAGDRGLGEAGDEPEQIELSRSLLSQLAAACGGLGKLEYAGTQAGDDTVRYRFAYRIRGMRVKLLTGSAGWTVFRNGELVELGFRPRTYTETGEELNCIPPLQAAAAAGSMQPGGIPELIVADPGAEAMTEPVWTLREGGA